MQLEHPTGYRILSAEVLVEYFRQDFAARRTPWRCRLCGTRTRSQRCPRCPNRDLWRILSAPDVLAFLKARYGVDAQWVKAVAEAVEICDDYSTMGRFAIGLGIGGDQLREEISAAVGRYIPYL